MRRVGCGRTGNAVLQADTRGGERRAQFAQAVGKKKPFACPPQASRRLSATRWRDSRKSPQGKKIPEEARTRSSDPRPLRRGYCPKHPPQAPCNRGEKPEETHIFLSRRPRCRETCRKCRFSRSG